MARSSGFNLESEQEIFMVILSFLYFQFFLLGRGSSEDSALLQKPRLHKHFMFFQWLFSRGNRFFFFFL